MTSLVRGPDILRALATGLDVGNNFAFLPHRRLIPAKLGTPAQPRLFVSGAEYVATSLLTLCNCYVTVFSAALGCPIPPMKANDQLNWLESNEGKLAGWFSVNETLAIERAALGYPTVAAAFKAPHGHIAMVMPSPKADPTTPYVSAAGAQNLMFAKLEASFGALTPAVRWFTHN